MENKNAEKMVQYVIGFLAEERKRKGLSYSKLGLKAGIHYTTISTIERGKQQPTLLTFKKLCNALDIELSPLIKKAEELL